jgi:hypothetical protein
MKRGDLVRFDHTMWPGTLCGRIALVLDVRKSPFGVWEDDIEFDVLMDGAVIKDLLSSRWDGSPHEGIEVINAAG